MSLPGKKALQDRVRLVHLVPGEDRSGFFCGLAEDHDRGRFDLSFLVVGELEGTFSQRLGDLGVRVHSIPYDGWRHFGRTCLQVANWLSQERAQILHTHVFLPSLLGALASTLAGIPLTVTTRHHSDYHFRKRKSVHLALDRLVGDLADGIVAVSDHTREYLIDREGFSPAKIRTIHNGVRVERIGAPDPGRIRQVRGELALDDGFSILLPGRLHPEKGTDLLLEALKILKEKGIVIRAFLAGEGPFREIFQADADRLGLSDDVSFLGFRQDVVTLMRAVDLVVLPSRVEAFGLVALETVAAGGLLVASSAGGIKEIVTHGKNGILVPPFDAQALAAAIEGLFRDPGRGRAILENTGPGILKTFGFPGMVRQYEEFYDGLLRNR